MNDKVKTKMINEFIRLTTEKNPGPPAFCKYYIECLGFKYVTVTLNFNGSRNFEILGQRDTKEPLKTVLTAGPRSKSAEVIVRQIDTKQGGNMELSMTFTTDRPNATHYKEAIAASRYKLQKIITWGKSMFPPEVVSISTTEELMDHCRNNKTIFIDTVFPPTDDSLYKGGDKDLHAVRGTVRQPPPENALHPVVWRRPVEFMAPAGKDAVTDISTIHIFEGLIEPKDIKQGQLGDCWLMSAIACIAEFPDLVQRLFISKEYNPYGVYRLRLCKHGEWTEIVLDDYFPCFPEDGPFYSRAHEGELWVMLIEKAFAKVQGSYATLRSGFPFEAMVDLTGMQLLPCFTYIS